MPLFLFHKIHDKAFQKAMSNPDVEARYECLIEIKKFNDLVKPTNAHGRKCKQVDTELLLSVMASTRDIVQTQKLLKSEGSS